MKNDSGFTLIELISVIFISALAVLVMVSAYIAGQQIFNTEKNISDILADSNSAMRLMACELRGARQIQSADLRNITFWWQDVNSNGSMEASEVITYSWNSTIDGNLLKTVSGNSTIISKYVKGFNLYYDSGVASSIKKVMVNLTTGIGSDVATLESTVTLRNLL